MSSQPVINIENLSKFYRLGLIGGGTLREDVNRAWARMRGKPDPLLKIGETDHGNRKGGMIWALRDINLEVKEGEILGVIGRNGAGKSTLLKILSRITAPTEGRAVIRGRVGSLLEVGTGFHPELTGRENTYLNGTILGMSKREVSAKLEEIVEFAEMAQFVDTPVKRYSSGMLVRLAFAVAAHLEPEILIIDEVLAVGDARFQKKCLGKMKDVSAHGRTVLFVSHNMVSIERLCTRAVLLANGSVEKEGRVEDVISAYASDQREKSFQRVWQSEKSAPGDENVTVRAAKLLRANDDSLPEGTLHIEEPIAVEVEIRVKVPKLLNLSLHLKTLSGSTILASSSPHFELDKGLMKYRCVIPGKLLNSGHYSISLLVASGGVALFWAENMFEFELTERSRNSPYSGKWPGIVRPVLNWTCDVSSKGSEVSPQIP